MKKKYFAVKIGQEPGIYTSWEECQKNINGYSGAEFKSFSDREQAQSYLDGDELEDVDKIERIYTESDAIAYLYGCYNVDSKEYAYGVLYSDVEGMKKFTCRYKTIEKDPSKNKISAEIEGAIYVMNYCINNSIKSLDLVFDCDGIQNWCTNAWRAKTDESRTYKDFYNKIHDKISIKFIKENSSSHSKNFEKAEDIAKHTLGLIEEEVKVYDGGIVAYNIEKSDLLDVFELVGEDFPDLEIEEKDIPFGHQYILKAKCQTYQKVIIRYYDKKTLNIVGRKEDLFNRLTDYLVQLLDDDEISNFLNTVHNVNINTDTIDDEFLKMFPHAYNRLPQKLNKNLHQAVYNLHISGNMYVTNYLVDPVLISMEAILKIALQQHDIPIREDDKDYDSFFVFTKSKDLYVLKDTFKRDTHSKVFLIYLSKLYTYFHKNRNTLLHWDNPLEEQDTTRILDTVEEAWTIIRDAIPLIDEYYSLYDLEGKE